MKIIMLGAPGARKKELMQRKSLRNMESHISQQVIFSAQTSKKEQS